MDEPPATMDENLPIEIGAGERFRWGVHLRGRACYRLRRRPSAGAQLIAPLLDWLAHSDFNRGDFQKEYYDNRSQ